ncbi:MAG: nucleotidyltransferase family protein [Acidimicrobiia bacterium]|nr:nucleotidyltransferase family protein [Acidimicrobiia bacterium]
MTIAAVILAAGAGSRFEANTHKLLAPAKGRPLVCWAVEAAVEAGLDETIVVTGAVDLIDILPTDVTVVHNEDWAKGQAISLQVALRYAGMVGHEAVVVGLGDMPAVPASAWRAVAEAEGDIVTATFDGRRSPPVKLDGAVWPLVPMGGDEGARSLLRSRPDLVVEVSCDGEPLDLDTVEDLRQWS